MVQVHHDHDPHHRLFPGAQSNLSPSVRDLRGVLFSRLGCLFHVIHLKLTHMSQARIWPFCEAVNAKATIEAERCVYFLERDYVDDIDPYQASSSDR